MCFKIRLKIIMFSAQSITKVQDNQFSTLNTGCNWCGYFENFEFLCNKKIMLKTLTHRRSTTRESNEQLLWQNNHNDHPFAKSID